MHEGMARGLQADTLQHGLMGEATEGEDGYRMSAATAPAQFTEFTLQKSRAGATLGRRGPIVWRQATNGIGDATGRQSRWTPAPSRFGETMAQQCCVQPVTGVVTPERAPAAVGAEPPRSEADDQQPRIPRPDGGNGRCMPAWAGEAIGIALHEQARTGATAGFEGVATRGVRQIDQAVSPRTRCGSSMP